MLCALLCNLTSLTWLCVTVELCMECKPAPGAVLRGAGLRLQVQAWTDYSQATFAMHQVPCNRQHKFFFLLAAGILVPCIYGTQADSARLGMVQEQHALPTSRWSLRKREQEKKEQ